MCLHLSPLKRKRTEESVLKLRGQSENQKVESLRPNDTLAQPHCFEISQNSQS